MTSVISVEGLKKAGKYGLSANILASKGCRTGAAALPMAHEIS
jgi:hypothetical protein